VSQPPQGPHPHQMPPPAGPPQQMPPPQVPPQQMPPPQPLLESPTVVGGARGAVGAPDVGTTIGPYVVERLLAVGGMGRVYVGTDTRLHRPVAIKVLLATMTQSEDFVARFEREASVMAKLDSPHVITIFDHGRVDGWPYLVTQYAAGGDLGTLIKQRGPLPGPLAADVCAQVADALAAAHAVGVIHRDVKAPNVLLRDERLDRPHVYLGDFGVAHTDSSGLTQPGSVAGTWNYLAPERAAGDRGSVASDLYSLGCLFYECLTGRAPYAGSDVEVALAHLQEPVPQLPGDDPGTQQANAILQRLLAKDPGERPVSAIEARDQLRLLSGRDHSFAAGPTVRRRDRGRRIALGATAAVVALALVAGGAWWAFGGEEEPPPAAAPTDAVTGDVDGDGRGDIALGRDQGNDEPAARVALGGDGAFQALGSAEEFGVANLAGDVNGDADVDLIRVSGYQSSFQVQTDVEGLGNGYIKIPRTDDLRGVFTADVDGNGRDDVGVISLSTGGSGLDTPDTVTADDGFRQKAYVALSMDDDTWTWREQWFAGPFTGDVYGLESHAGDLDGDGDDDLILGSSYGTEEEDIVKNVLIAEDGAFTEAAVPDPVTSVPYGARLVLDVDGDGTDELAYLDSDTSIEVFGLQDEEWVQQDWTISGSAPEDVTPMYPFYSDVDGDGDDDVLFRNYLREGTDDRQYDDSVTVLVADHGTFTAEQWEAPDLGAADSLAEPLIDVNG